jgi:hypothetical protein
MVLTRRTRGRTAPKVRAVNAGTVAAVKNQRNPNGRCWLNEQRRRAQLHGRRPALWLGLLLVRAQTLACEGPVPD